MTNDQFFSIKEIIDEDIESKNIDDLRKLKEYILRGIYVVENTIPLTEQQQIILGEDLLKFIDDNFTKEERRILRPSMFNMAIGNLRKKSPVKVYDALGLDADTIDIQRGITKKSFFMFSDKLKEFGISIENTLIEEQIYEIEHKQKQK